MSQPVAISECSVASLAASIQVAQEPLGRARSGADRSFRSSRTSRAKPCRCGASTPRKACAIGSETSGSRRRGGPPRGRDWHESRPVPGDRPARPDGSGRSVGPERTAERRGPAAVSTTGDATRPRRPTRLPAAGTIVVGGADFPRQHRQHDLVGVGRCNQVNGYLCLGGEILLPAPGSQAIKIGRITSSVVPASRARSSAAGNLPPKAGRA